MLKAKLYVEYKVYDDTDPTDSGGFHIINDIPEDYIRMFIGIKLTDDYSIYDILQTSYFNITDVAKYIFDPDNSDSLYNKTYGSFSYEDVDDVLIAIERGLINLSYHIVLYDEYSEIRALEHYHLLLGRYKGYIDRDEINALVKNDINKYVYSHEYWYDYNNKKVYNKLIVCGNIASYINEYHSIDFIDRGLYSKLKVGSRVTFMDYFRSNLPYKGTISKIIENNIHAVYDFDDGIIDVDPNQNPYYINDSFILGQIISVDDKNEGL